MSKKKRKTSNMSHVIQTRCIAYTDGGCMVNPGGPGGYGVVILDSETGESKEFSDAYRSTTNNRMEVLAILRALEETAELEEPITVISDSQYAINCASGVWGRNKNFDLWEIYKKLARSRTVYYEWVRGHSGNQYNERCDELATMAMQSGPYKEDTGYADVKRQGREFYERLEKHEVSSKSAPGGAMGIKIDIPPALEKEFEYMSGRQYAEKHHVHSSCASAITDFYIVNNRSFKAYAALKTGGMDHWSRQKEGAIVDAIGEDVWEEIGKYLPDPKQRMTCARWVCRGLKLSDAIRKVLVDEEISANCLR